MTTHQHSNQQIDGIFAPSQTPQTQFSSPFEHNFPPSQAVPPLPPSNQPLTWTFAFRGNATDYFKIWISNLFLTIITFSLYAPWAKVRRLQYFYGNTYLNRHNFSFTALPTRILIGRLIAMALFLIISIVSQFAPEYSVMGTLLLFVISPWLIRSTMRFRARNSKYGNVRFIFNASLIKSYAILMLCAFLTLFTFGLAYPIALLFFKRYQLNHLKLGQLKFNFTATMWDFYKAVLRPYLFAIGIIIVFAIAMVILAQNLTQESFAMLSILMTAGYIFTIAFVFPLINAYLFQATWNNVSVGKNKMSTDIHPYRYAWIQLSNYLAIIFSLGLLFAWAQIRMYSYQMQHLHVTFVDNPEHLLNAQQQDYNSIAEEISDVFDIDISL